MNWSYLDPPENSTTLPMQLIPEEPGYRHLWPGEVIPAGAQEYYDRSKRWLPCERVGQTVQAPALHNMLRCRVVRVPC